MASGINPPGGPVGPKGPGRVDRTQDPSQPEVKKTSDVSKPFGEVLDPTAPSSADDHEPAPAHSLRVLHRIEVDSARDILPVP